MHAGAREAHKRISYRLRPVRTLDFDRFTLTVDVGDGGARH